MSLKYKVSYHSNIPEKNYDEHYPTLAGARQAMKANREQLSVLYINDTIRIGWCASNSSIIRKS